MAGPENTTTRRDDNAQKPSSEPAQQTDAQQSTPLVQLRGKSLGEQQAALTPGVQGFSDQLGALAPAPLAPTQMKGGGESTEAVHAAAQRGTAGGGGSLPHLGKIQAAFGGHDVSSVQAYSGGAATEASAAMGAEAYASGNKVAFGAAPSLHTAAHEAAHVVQQRAGVSLSGGVGQVGDRYEQHADKVADAVVQGRSAEGLLGEMTGVSSGGPVQRRSANVQREEGGPGLLEQAADLALSTLAAAAATLDDVVEIALDYGQTGLSIAVSLAQQLGVLKDFLLRMAAESAETLGQALEYANDEWLVPVLDAAPDLVAPVMSLLWPVGQGWAATLQLAGDVTIAGSDVGFPLDLVADSDTTVELAVHRTGDTVVEAGMKVLSKAGAGAVPTVKAAEIPIKGTFVQLSEWLGSTDFSKITWSPLIVQGLRNSQYLQAFQAMWGVGKDFYNATQVTRVAGLDVGLSIGGELGLDTVVKGSAELAASIGGKLSVKSPTPDLPGESVVEGHIDGGVKLGVEFGKNYPQVAELLKLVGEVTGQIGARFAWDHPTTTGQGHDGLKSVSIFGRGAGSLEGLGSKGQAGAEIEYFIYENGKTNGDLVGTLKKLGSGQGLTAQDLENAIPGSSVKFVFDAGVDTDLLTGFATGNTVSTSLIMAGKVTFDVPRARVIAMLQRNAQAQTDALRALLAGDFVGWLKTCVEKYTENMADFVKSLDSIELEFREGLKGNVSGATPGAGDVTGAKGALKGKIEAVQKIKLTAADVGASTVEQFLRNVA